MKTETLELPVEEGIEFLAKAGATVDEIVKLPIADMPLSLIAALLDLRDASKALSEAMTEVRRERNR